MLPNTPGTELKVGLFLLLGTVLAGALVLKFGGFRTGGAGGYPVVVEVRDATGIRPGVPVRLGGVDIGRVADEPSLNKDYTLLSVPLAIFPGRGIPVGSTVKVGTSGIMGDSYIRILPPEEPSGEFLPEGARLRAEPASTFADLAGEAGEVFEDVGGASAEVRLAAQRLERLAARLDEEFLSKENVENLGRILADLRGASEVLRTASKRVAPLMDEAGGSLVRVGEAADAAAGSFARVDEGVGALTGTLDKAAPVLAELDATLDDLRKTLASANSLLTKLEQGDGLAPALLSDSAMKRDLESFAAKLNRHGILLYPREGGLGPFRGAANDDAGEAGEDRRPFPGLRRQP